MPFDKMEDLDIPHTVCSQCGMRNSIKIPDMTQNEEIPIDQIRSTYSIAPEEKLLFLSDVKEGEDHLRRLDQEVAHLQGILSKLKSKRDAIKRYVDAKKHVAAPIRRLPVEVLQKIFLECSPKVVLSDPHGFVGQVKRVCHLWRTVAIHTPELWSNIWLYRTKSEYKHFMELKKYNTLRETIFKHCLSHCGVIPITLSLITVAHHENRILTFDSNLSVDFKLVLTQSISRFRDLCLSSRLFFTLFRADLGALSPLTSLSSLTLVGGIFGNRINYSQEIVAPNLTRAVFINLNNIPHSVKFPYHQLTSFTIDIREVKSSTNLHMLPSMPLLTELSIASVHNDPSSYLNFSLACLKSLTIRSSTHFIRHVLEMLTAPSLQRLHILGSGGRPASIKNTVLDFLRRSSCSITDLALHEVYTSCAEAIIEDTPLLETLSLKLYVGTATPILLARLINQPDRPSLCRYLREFTLDLFKNPAEETVVAVALKMILSRLSSQSSPLILDCTPLQSARLQCDIFTTETLCKMTEFAAQTTGKLHFGFGMANQGGTGDYPKTPF